jgi:hypothetical protein
MSTDIIRDYNGERPLYPPAVYIHLFSPIRKPNLLERLAAFLRRKVTTTRNK